ncbi:MAG: isoprenylcysteine carboxylmethyltransferase family protein [Hyphomonadaceae bacterium JAD_PAG50586_4]|nr:MAG: isoprenylcysteine carboxylmethyltransferase family protein [Hyphomonadaceae bacterium JAD_PAG50586_4]
MPPAWLPLAALSLIVVASALRVWSVARAEGIKAFDFGRARSIQVVAERNWKVSVCAALGLALLAWLAPEWERSLGRPEWSTAPSLRWISALLFSASAAVIVVAQLQMGASWRIGVPRDGPGALVSRGLFAWSRNPIFVGLVGAFAALFLWSPNIATAAVLAAVWTLTLVQVRIEEEALRETHGDAYEAYAARVGRWFGRRRIRVSLPPGAIQARPNT